MAAAFSLKLKNNRTNGQNLNIVFLDQLYKCKARLMILGNQLLKKSARICKLYFPPSWILPHFVVILCMQFPLYKDKPLIETVSNKHRIVH